MKVIWLIIRGICGNPSDCLEWEQRAVDWILQDPYCRERGYTARSDTYSCLPLTVWMREKERAHNFANVLKTYVDAGFKIHIMCHSNGTRVAREGMRLLKWPRVETVHFLNGACDSDFNRTGFNWAIKRNRIGLFYYYVAGRDWAMKIENTILGKLDFALPENSCPLGLRGPRFVDKQVTHRVIEGSRDWGKYGHSTALDDDHFDGTMQLVTRAKTKL